jgi:WD40 repeat protein
MASLRRTLCVIAWLTLVAIPPAIGEPPTVQDRKAPKEGKARTDRYGDPLPDGAIGRLGTTRLRHGGMAVSVALSPDGKTVASAGREGTVSLWEVSTGKELHRIRPDIGPVFVTFSPDGKTLAVRLQIGHAEVWDVSIWKKLFKKGRVGAIAFAPDGKTLLSGGRDSKGRPVVVQWEATTGNEIRRFAGHDGEINALALSPDNKTLVSAAMADRNDNREVIIWDALTRKARNQFKERDDPVSTIAFSPDGKTLAWGDSYKTIFWDVGKGKEIRRWKAGEEWTTALAFAPNFKVVAFSGYKDYTIRLVDRGTGKEIRKLAGHSSPVQSVSFSANGKTLASGGYDHAIRLWDVATGKPLHTFEGHNQGVAAVAYSPDGRLIASGGTSGFIGFDEPSEPTILLWDVASTRVVRRLKGHKAGVTSIRFSPTGKRLASGSSDKTVRLWNPTTGKELAQLSEHNNGMGVTAISFSPDEEMLATADGRTVKLWEVKTGERIRTIFHEGKNERTNCVAFSPDGKTLAVGYGTHIRLCSVTTGEGVQALERHQEEITSVVFSPDGKMLASTSNSDRSVRLWDPATGKEIRRIDVKAAGENLWVVFSPDSKYLAFYGDTEAIRLWEVATGKEVARFAGHRDMIGSVAFCPGGRVLASGGWDTSILLWDLTGGMDGSRMSLPAWSKADLQTRWADLAGPDAAIAFRTAWQFVDRPREAIPFIVDQLKPVPSVPEKRILQLIADLDNERFEKRRTAAKELEVVGQGAEACLRRTLDGKPSAEVRRQATQLLEKIEATKVVEALRLLRTIQILENTGSAEAMKVLADLAKNAPETRLKQEAKASLERLKRLPLPAPTKPE